MPQLMLNTSKNPINGYGFDMDKEMFKTINKQSAVVGRYDRAVMGSRKKSAVTKDNPKLNMFLRSNQGDLLCPISVAQGIAYEIRA